MQVIFDIDGTLADCSHRLPYIVQHPKDWEAFFDPVNVMQDAPIEPMLALMRVLLIGGTGLFLTGRPEKLRSTTMRWLTHHAPVTMQVGKGALYMRPDGDYRKSAEVKRDLLHRALADGYAPVLAFEDHRDDAAMYRAEGIICCHVAKGDY